MCIAGPAREESDLHRCAPQHLTRPPHPCTPPVRRVIILVKAGAPVDATVAQLAELMEPGDIIIDGGNEW